MDMVSQCSEPSLTKMFGLLDAIDMGETISCEVFPQSEKHTLASSSATDEKKTRTESGSRVRSG